MDLNTVEGVLAYLESTPFASSSVTRLSGGYCNATYRLHLLNPHEGRETLVLKHSSHQIIINGSLELPVSRQKYEATALRLVKAHLSSSIQAITTVPKVHLFDEDAHVLIMEDASSEPGANLVTTLKDLLINPKHVCIHTRSPQLGEEIGAALGAFLAGLHALGKNHDVDLSYFRENDMGRKITAATTYGVLESTLTGKDNIPFIDDPPLGISESDLAVIRQIAQKRIAEIQPQDVAAAERQTMTHGDFWPGNIMICLNTSDNGDSAHLKRLYVLDWEVAKTCIPALDVGQCCAELSLVRWWFGGTPGADAAGTILQAYLGAYGREANIRVDAEDSRKIELDQMGRDIAMQVGTHYVCWQSRYPWGEKERVRAVVKDGVAMLVQAGGDGTGGTAALNEYMTMLGA